MDRMQYWPKVERVKWQRKCLSCGKRFMATHGGVLICASCTSRDSRFRSVAK